MHRWERETSELFLGGSLLYFLFGVVIAGFWPPRAGDLEKACILLSVAWLGFWAWRWNRKRQEAKVMETAELEVIPPQAHPDDAVQCVLRFNPPVSVNLRSWEVILVECVRWDVNDHREVDRLNEASSAERPNVLLVPKQRAQFTLSLRVPAKAIPTRKSEGIEVFWSVRVYLRFADSPEWRLEEPLEFTVLPPRNQALRVSS